jgi:erythromycin esterase-like protein
MPLMRISKGFVILLAIVTLATVHPLFAQAKEEVRGRGDSRAIARAIDSVCRKQVVALGELPSHGEARAFQAKAEIVRGLVERCGFDTVLFEAPIYDFVGFEAAVASRTATQAHLDRAIGRFWLARELDDWRRWLFERASKGKLNLGGLDDQVSVTSDYARANLPRLVEASMPAGGPKGCAEIVERHLYWRYDASKPFDEREQLSLYNCTRSAADRVVSPRMAQKPSPEKRMLASFAGYAARQQGTGAASDRDHSMYINYAWYEGRRRKPPKVIIWTATVHAARRQGVLPKRPLGDWLARRHGSRFGAIGFTAFSGMSSMAGRPPQPLQEAPPGSLESLSLKARDGWTFLDSSKLRKIGAVPARLMGKFTEADWSMYFDAVLVVQHEVAPTFEK